MGKNKITAIIYLVAALLLFSLFRYFISADAQDDIIVPDYDGEYIDYSPETELDQDNIIENYGGLIEEYPAETDGYYQGYYDLDYLLNSFGVIAFGSADIEQHCMGSLLVRGNLSGNANNFADTPYINEPSYIGGYVSKPGGPNGRSKYSGVPLYVGSSNTVDGTTLNGIVNYSHGDPIFISDEYISWAWVYASAVDTIDYVQEISAGAEPIKVQWSWQEIEIRRGTIVNLIVGQNNYCKIRLVGDYTGEDTVINVLDGGTVLNPQVVGIPEGEENAGSEPICIMYPYAENVIVPVELTPEIGCIIAPNADIEVRGGNTNGCLFGWNVTTYGEGHMWPFVPITKPDEKETEQTETEQTETEESETELLIETQESETETEEFETETETEPFIETETELPETEIYESQTESEPETQTQPEEQTEEETETEQETEIQTEEETEAKLQTETETEEESETQEYESEEQSEYDSADKDKLIRYTLYVPYNWDNNDDWDNQDQDENDDDVRDTNRNKNTTISSAKNAGNLTRIKPPKTGDENPIIRLIGAALISIFVFICLIYHIRNRRD